MISRPGRIVAFVLAILTLLPVRSASAEGITTDTARDAAWNRLAEVGQQSTDLRLRILFSTGDLVQRGKQFVWEEAIPIETLVEQARGSTDPIVLSLLVDRCFVDMQKTGRCDAVDFARRWTIADTQNQLAWIALSTTLSTRGDTAGAREAFRRAAQASEWHEYTFDIARLIEAAAPKTTEPKARADTLMAVLSKAFVGLPSGHYQTVSNQCKDSELIAACGRILDVMARDTQSLMTLGIAAALANRRSALPPSTVTSMRQRYDALMWATIAGSRRYGDAETTEQQRLFAKHVESVIALGELETLRRDLQASRLTEREAAARQVATLSPENLASRAAPSSTSATPP